MNENGWHCFSTVYLLHNGGPYHVETSPLICLTNQWTGFYMIGTSAMQELNRWKIMPADSRKFQKVNLNLLSDQKLKE